jgi:subtilisin family serine protease
MAAPHVSGVVALMRSAAPALTAPRLIKLVKLTASNCGNYINGTGWGTVNAHRAVAAALGRDTDAPVSSLKRKKGRTFKVSSADSGSAVSCSPELPSSGVDEVRILASRNGKDFRVVEKSAKSKFRFKPKRKGRYRLYSVAVDNAGNEEAAPIEADAKLKVKKLKPRRAARKRR